MAPIPPNRRPMARPVTPPPPPTPPPVKTKTLELNHGALPGYIRMFPETIDVPKMSASRPVTLYALIGTWFEGDIITATIKNCFANGCQKVFVIDNNSPDDTREKAMQAGATVFCNFTTEYYDDDMRLRLMNHIMKDITVEEKLPELWWLSLDADEFPCGPQGQRVIDFLSELDPRYNCVGTTTIDLYPTNDPGYHGTIHPADCMPMGIPRRGPFCNKQHWKHPLLKQTSGHYHISQARGSHVCFVKDMEGHPFIAMIEPTETITLFHAPIRAKEMTFRRLKTMCEGQQSLKGNSRGALDDVATENNGSIKRWRSLEHIYAKQWDQVELAHSQMYGKNLVGIALLPWTRLLKNLPSFPRWYDLSKPEIEPIKKQTISLPIAH